MCDVSLNMLFYYRKKDVVETRKGERKKIY